VDKAEKIKRTLQRSVEKGKGLSSFSLKNLSREKERDLRRAFLEAKWLYNWLVSDTQRLHLPANKLPTVSLRLGCWSSADREQAYRRRGRGAEGGQTGEGYLSWGRGKERDQAFPSSSSRIRTTLLAALSEAGSPSRASTAMLPPPKVSRLA